MLSPFAARLSGIKAPFPHLTINRVGGHTEWRCGQGGSCALKSDHVPWIGNDLEPPCLFGQLVRNAMDGAGVLRAVPGAASAQSNSPGMWEPAGRCVGTWPLPALAMVLRLYSAGFRFTVFLRGFNPGRN